ncbi:MAG: TerB N-terminal domain-containing protein [Bellilinea sp.]
MPTSPLPSNFSLGIKKCHPAKLYFINETSHGDVGIGGRIKISLNLDVEPQIEYITPDEPSTIYKNLPVIKPDTPNMVETPPYYPTYTDLLPEQRWIYLKWLKDITEGIDIGYVFLYYYGLERHLLVGDFEAAFQEVLLLRRYHTNRSFEAYSYNALLYSSVFRNLTDQAQFVINNESRNGIDNVDLLFKFRFEKAISAGELISLAKKIKGTNIRYIKSAPDHFKTAISTILNDKFGVGEYPLSSRFQLEDIPRQQTVAFANISFPSSVRTPILPNFLGYSPFLIECNEIFSDAHELVKRDLKCERLNNV